MRVRASTLVLLLVLAAPAALFAEPRPMSTSGGFRVIVNAANGNTSLERRFLSDVFLKKVTRWPNGDVIRPVDLATKSPVRRAFSDDVVGRGVEEVKSYWQQAIFSGRDIPPPELDTDDAVVSYVLKHPGAIGYVSTTANLNGAKIVTLR
jgi:ABC-type phosphate transport system substrate-binding protein